MKSPDHNPFPAVNLVHCLANLVHYLYQAELLDLSIPAVRCAFDLLTRYDACFPQSQLISTELKRVIRASSSGESIQVSSPGSEEVWIK